MAARLTSALSFFFAAILLGLLGQIFLPRLPFMASLVYASSLLPFIASNLVTTDSLLALWQQRCEVSDFFAGVIPGLHSAYFDFCIVR